MNALRKLLFAWVLMYVAIAQTFAQVPDSLNIPYFSIISPGYLTQQYEAALSQFGQANFGSGIQNGDVVASLAVAEADQFGAILFCDPTLIDFTGKIVLISRGECEFGLKALHAQQQGAVGVIIQNFEDSFVGMGMGLSGSMVNIPVIMVTKFLGDVLKAAVFQGENVVVGFTAAPYHFGKINGKITGDLNANCSSDASEPGLGNWLVTADGTDQSYSVRTHSDGSFSLYADSINSPYSITATPYNDLWQICPPVSAIAEISGAGDTVTVDFTAKPSLICPQLSVNMGTPLLRRCFENWFNVEVCNYGSMAAENAYIAIHMDTPGFEPIQNANLPFSLDANGDYRFELGTMDIGECAYIHFSAIVSCDSVVIGQTLCFSAHAYPDTFCILPGQNWSGANVSVTGTCNNGENPQFVLQNTGTATMSQSEDFIVLRNGMLQESGQFQLTPGQTQIIDLPGDGATWRVEATQEQNHPIAANPSATLEGCSTIGAFDTGFALQFSVYDPNEAVDIECMEVIGSYDPNDKQGFPLGATDEHLILPNTSLEYLIRFQNTGTDTAFNIVVRDTLSPFLAVESVRPGVASAAYDFEIVNGNVLVFRFNNIQLVDSFKNEAASHGFLRFQIDQKPNLDWGTEIHNTAAIYFDFNPPVITNTSQHKLGVVPNPSAVHEVLVSSQNAITVFPNPAKAAAELSLSKEMPTGTRWRLINASGKNMESGILQSNRLKINNLALPSGVYWIEFSLNGKWFGVAKWVVQ
ncbi:MAG: T9SS type A sorting domain-containing protein [Saprospiraceae bacterium]|nr:T9SS type A sorting domain-containing protein [Saprospiraceae bacterium]